MRFIMKWTLGLMAVSCPLILITTLSNTREIEAASRTFLERFTAGAGSSLSRDVVRDLQNILKDLHKARENKMPPEKETIMALKRTLEHLSTEASFTSAQQVSLQEVFTVATDVTRVNDTQLEILLKDIASRYDGLQVVVCVGSDAALRVSKQHKNVRGFRVTSSTPVAVRWSRLLAMVNTTYVLVGRGLIALSSFSDLERLFMTFLQVPNAAFVGGASRNQNGQWRVGCYQTRMLMYVLTLQHGYTSFDYGCMFCDSVAGPFITTTNLVSSIPIDVHLPGEVVFSDWFLRIRAAGGLGLVCPDVLFFVSDEYHPWKSRTAWEAIASKWNVTDVHLPDDFNHHYSCMEARLNCSKVDKSLALPSCCLALLGGALHEVVSAVQEQYIDVHIMNKTAVAGVVGGQQSWEMDAHLAVQNATLQVQLAMLSLNRRGYHVDIAEDGATYYIHLHSTVIFLHLLNVDMKAGLPLQQAVTPTTILVGNAWLPAPPNPGLYVRHLRGSGFLQHPLAERPLPQCHNPSHHACLHHFPFDTTLRLL
ncbi:uncharacterized protein [Cherax quadricarinatus]|uniref:uncharacterized protein isoform X2 n=1 Tax=Cherax quadricarinatus TaxID=27406 RepID=UPI00387E36D2